MKSMRRCLMGLAATLGCLLGTPRVSGAPQGTPPWWDNAWSFRAPLTVTAGANAPSGGYLGYTARISNFDTTALVTAGWMLANGNDLRVLRWDGAAWTELPRHGLSFNSAATDVRFKLAADIVASAADTSYWFYYGNPSAGAPPPVTSTNVYLFWDDAAVDRIASYTLGRVDESAHAGSGAGTIVHNAGGYYVYTNADGFATSARPTGLAERDVHVEYEFFHVTSWPTDITSGPLARLRITGGTTGAGETSDGHYFYEMADTSLTGGVGYPSHGDITQTNRAVDIDGTDTALAQIPNNTWVRTSLAAWGIAPNNLRAIYDPAPTAGSLGGFGATPTLSASHTDVNLETGGQAGAWFQQDDGRFRNLLARRYTAPEPSSSVGAQQFVGGGSVPPPPPPRVNDHDEGIFGDSCACGSGGAGARPGLTLVAVLLGLLVLGRRR